MDTSGDIKSFTSTPVSDSSIHHAASSSSSPSLLRDDVALTLAPLNILSALIQAQIEINTIDILSSSQLFPVKSSGKSIPNDISASGNEPLTQPQLWRYLKNYQIRSFQFSGIETALIRLPVSSEAPYLLSFFYLLLLSKVLSTKATLPLSNLFIISEVTKNILVLLQIELQKTDGLSPAQQEILVPPLCTSRLEK